MMIGRKIRQFFMKPIELYKSKNINIDSVDTLGIILGPYRNLTTLTGSILMLHPKCQVLNHAGMRILNWRCLNFMRNPTQSTWERFIRYAIYISGRGQRGDYGGSITYSHAFQHEEIKNKYANRFGSTLIKNEINSVIWKESLRVAKYIRKHDIEVKSLLDKFSGLRFIQPVRNPLDCTRSNLKTNKSEEFKGLSSNPDFEETLSAILSEYRWFMEMREENSNQFFYFMEYEFEPTMLNGLAQFLELPTDEEWVEDVLEIYENKSTYDHSQEDIEYYRREVESKFNKYPDFAEKLMEFIN